MRRGKKDIVWLAVAAGLWLWTGCLPSPPTAPDEEPPLSSTVPTGRDADPARLGQQEASLQLTEQGRRHLLAGETEEAITVFEKAISVFPSNPYAYYYLGKARYLRKEYPRSIAPLGQAELYLSGDRVWLARVYALRGRAYEGLSRFVEARGQYQQALRSDPGNDEAREGMMRLEALETPP